MAAGAHFAGSATAAVINFPLWKAAAIGQSGFKEAADFYGRMKLIFGPPYKGVTATIFGMTWARAAIFYGSDVGRDAMLERGWSKPLASTVPPLGLAAFVQLANQPIVRATIQLQDPSSNQPNILAQLMELYRTKGFRSLYHGASASILKTVPKYVCAIWVKDWVAASLPPPSAPKGHPDHRNQVMNRAAAKSVAAGVAGAALTNWVRPLVSIHRPLWATSLPCCLPAVLACSPRARWLETARAADVIRNEMFKYEEGMMETISRLLRTEGWAFCTRGMQRNLVAVAAPIGMTIFITEALTEMLQGAK